jgi:hypothetical protein
MIPFRVSNRAGEEVTLRVYDVQAREVVRLLKRRLSTRPHFVRWTGADERGVALASGTYVAKLRMGSRAETRMMTLVR